jgi:hypothetical protein
MLDRPIALSDIARRPRRRIHDTHPAVTPGALDGYIGARERVVWDNNPHWTVGILQMDKRGRRKQDANAGGRPHSRGLL